MQLSCIPLHSILLERTVFAAIISFHFFSFSRTNGSIKQLTKFNRWHAIDNYAFICILAPLVSCNNHLHPFIFRTLLLSSMILSLELTAIFDNNLSASCTRSGSNGFNSADNIHAFNNRSKHNVLAIQPACLSGTKEELRTC